MLQSAIQALLTQVGVAVSGLSPFAKAIVPVVLALASAAVNSALAGSFDTTSLVVLGIGVLSSVLTFLVPNATSAPAPAPKPPAGK